MTRAVLLSFLALLAQACGSDDSKPAEHLDGGTGGAGDDFSLDCDPVKTALALSAASANQLALRNLGDVDPVGPDDVGDGLYHLFAGVAHEDITGANSWGAVLIHDATSPTAKGEYTLPATPIVEQRDDYDHFGIEVPTYLRFDAHTEYIYYCGLYAEAKGHISALERTDGGAWKKLGPVAPFAPGSISQCEPDVVLDPKTGTIYLMFIADGDASGMRIRTSKSPTSFAVETEIGLGKYFTRIATSRDPFADVWRYSLDVGGYPLPIWTAQSWTTSLPPDDPTLQDHGEILHAGTHDLHPEIHANGAFVSQTGGAFYPSADEVVFLYTGQQADAVNPNMRVFSQSCTRR